MRLRQAVVVARDLEGAVADFTAVLGIRVAFRDPSVAAFGLKNAVMPVGDTFLEVVSPVDPNATAARYLERRRGDGGYMLIVQCDELDRDRDRLGELGVRIVWKLDLEDIRGTHLHPRDTRGTLLSLDDARPASSWRWAGREWERYVDRSVVETITGADLQAEDPDAVARRWAEILDRPAREVSPSTWEITLDSGRLRFAETRDGRGEGLSAFEVRALDPTTLFAAARSRGLETAGDEVSIRGIRLRITDGRNG